MTPQRKTTTRRTGRPPIDRSLPAAIACLGWCCLGSLPAGARAGDALMPGKLTIDPPTLICLGVHWAVEGDDDGDATCRVEFRRAGRGPWRRGLGLWRTCGEVCGDERWTPPVYVTPNAFAGSIFDLEPGCEYELRLTLCDPDGVTGKAVRTVSVATRPVPQADPAGRRRRLAPIDILRRPIRQKARIADAPAPYRAEGQVFHVLPPSADHGEHAKYDRSRHGLLHAWYGYRMYCDWAFDPRRIGPGERIVVHAGVYLSNRRDYRVQPGYSLWFHGTHFLAGGAAPDSPIVIEAAGDGEVVFDGDGCDTLFDVTHADHVVFKGITFRNCRVAIKAGDASRGAKDLRVIDCRFVDVDLPLLATNRRCGAYEVRGNTVDGQADDLLDGERVVGVGDLLLGPGAEPGDVIELSAGTYRVRRPGDDEAGPWRGGTFALHASGTPDRPIVIRPAGDGEVIFDGGGCDTLFDVRDANHIHFEGIVFRNAKIAIKAGLQFLNGCQGLVVKRCRFENVGYAVCATSGRCRNAYIADNRMTCWEVRRVRGAGSNQTYDREFGYGVNVLGTGHVVCHNDISGFWDNLNVNTNGHGDPNVGRPAIAIDVYNNLVGAAGDNAGEADGSVRNVRFLRNRCSFTCQPIRGGPVYFIRNLGEPTKYATHPSGVVAYHNRLMAVAPRGGKHEFVNNLVVWGWKPMLLDLQTDSPPGRINGNAYRLWRKGQVAEPERWVLHWPGTKVEANSLAEAREKAGVEARGILLKQGGDEPLIDSALLLHNVNDDYAGDGPDIGPVEHGRPPVHYGPRPGASATTPAPNAVRK